MIARRALPSDIYCDNATNFAGAANHLHELKKFMFDRMSDFINFHFIPPRTPHFGRLWEAAVKSVKGLLNILLLLYRLIQVIIKQLLRGFTRAPNNFCKLHQSSAF